MGQPGVCVSTMRIAAWYAAAGRSSRPVAACALASAQGFSSSRTHSSVTLISSDASGSVSVRGSLPTTALQARASAAPSLQPHRRTLLFARTGGSAASRAVRHAGLCMSARDSQPQGQPAMHSAVQGVARRRRSTGRLLAALVAAHVTTGRCSGWPAVSAGRAAWQTSRQLRLCHQENAEQAHAARATKQAHAALTDSRGCLACTRVPSQVRQHCNPHSTEPTHVSGAWSVLVAGGWGLRTGRQCGVRTKRRAARRRRSGSWGPP